MWTLFFLIFIILVLVLGWHILFALLGGVILIGATVWGIAVASVVIFCVAILLSFLFVGIGGILVGGFLTLWTLIAIILFPVLFPILLPLFIIFGFITYSRRKKNSDVA